MKATALHAKWPTSEEISFIRLQFLAETIHMIQLCWMGVIRSLEIKTLALRRAFLASTNRQSSTPLVHPDGPLLSAGLKELSFQNSQAQSLPITTGPTLWTLLPVSPTLQAQIKILQLLRKTTHYFSSFPTIPTQLLMVPSFLVLWVLYLQLLLLA